LEPEILIVDEVLAVGDAEFQRRCLGKMETVARSGRTVLFVSHNMNAVEQLCRHALLLKKGEVARFSSDVRAVIQEHLFGSGDQEKSTEWRNSGEQFPNRWFRPIRFRITDENGAPAKLPLSNSSPMWIEIEGDIEELDPALTIGYALYSEEGHLLYWSYATDLKEEEWPKMQKGRNIIRSQIPPRFLNEGVFRAELVGGLHFREWLFEPGVTAPAIIFSIQGGLSDSPTWMVRRPGILAPNFKWKKV
jgi:lipopolysaccharide transport system ATP-binding protein